MSDLRGIWNLLLIAWRVDWRKTTAGIVLAVVRAVALPLLAALLGAMTNDVVSGRPVAAAWYGGLVALLTIITLSFGSFIQVIFLELAELAELDFVEQLMTVSNGTVRIEHHEFPEYADVLTVLKQESRRFPNALLALFNSVGLFLAVIFTAVLLVELSPFLLLLPLAAIPPLLAAQRAGKLTERAKSRTAASTRVAQNLFRLTASARTAANCACSSSAVNCVAGTRSCGERSAGRVACFFAWRALFCSSSFAFASA